MKSGHVLGVLGACTVMGTLGLIALSSIRTQSFNTQKRALSAALDNAIADYRRHANGEGRFAPPPLRGDRIEGNGADAQREIASKMAAIDDKNTLSEIFARCGDPADDLVGWTRAHAAELAEMRAASRRSYAWTDIRVELGTMRAPSIDYKPTMRAHRMLLVEASRAEPAECLRESADVARLAQQLVPGSGIVGAMVAASSIAPITSVMRCCAARASAAELEGAAREARALIEGSPPFGGALEVEGLMSGVVMRDTDTFEGALPMNSREVEQWAQRGYVLDVWSKEITDLPRFRSASPADYPLSAKPIEDLDTMWTGSPNPLLQIARPSFREYLYKNMEAEARLRMAALMLHALSERRPDGSLPERPSALSDKAFRDPFTGSPLGYARVGASFKIWSAGKNRHDDGGTGDDIVAESPASTR